MVISGLDKNSIVDNIINVRYREQLNLIEDETLRNGELNKIKTYLSDTCAGFFETAIREIQSVADSLNEICVAAKTAAQNIVVSNAIPAVIAVPPAAPNVAYTLIDNRQKKASVTSLVQSGVAQMAQLEAIAQGIDFTLPPPVMAMKESLRAIMDILRAIPD